MKKLFDFVVEKPIMTCIIIGSITTSAVKIIKAVKKAK